MPTPPDDLHALSFTRFLQPDIAPEAREDHGLEGIFRALFPLTTDDGLCELQYCGYLLDPPKFDARESQRRGLAWVAALKVTLRLVLWERARDTRSIVDVKEQEIYSGEVPMATDRGSLVTWEGERVAGLQLARATDLEDVRDLPDAVTRAVYRARQDECAARGAVSPWRLLALGDHLEAAAWHGLHAVVTDARERLVKAHARAAAGRLLPVDVYNAKRLAAALRHLIAKSPLLRPVDALTPLARAAEHRRVSLDEGAREALEGSAWARWIRPHDDDTTPTLLARDAPVDARGYLVADVRIDAALSSADPLAQARDALLLDAPDPFVDLGPHALRDAARGGGCVLATGAGVVLRASERRLWVRDDGDDTPRCHALLPPVVPCVPTPLHLRPVVAEGARYVAGDVLAASGFVRGGALCLGRRLTVGHGRGLAAGACRVSSRAAEALRALREETVRVEVRDTREGRQAIVPALEGLDAHALRHLDASGVVSLGAEVEPGDVLVARAVQAWEEAAGGGFVERSVPAEVRATTRGTVVRVDMLSRRGVELDARYVSLAEARREDVAAEAEEHVATLVASGLDVDDARVASARELHRRRLDDTFRGEELPSGVILLVHVVMLVREALAPGDTLGDLAGNRWRVAEITDDAELEVAVPEAWEAAPREVVRLRAGEPAATKARARRRR